MTYDPKCHADQPATAQNVDTARTTKGIVQADSCLETVEPATIVKSNPVLSSVRVAVPFEWHDFRGSGIEKVWPLTSWQSWPKRTDEEMTAWKGWI